MKTLFIIALLLWVSPVSADETLTVYVVRHAEKQADAGKNPGLTDAGESRAENLSSLLCKTGIDAVYSTDYLRTRQTVLPLVVCANRELQLYDPSEPGELVQQVLNDDALDSVVIVGHSNTVGGIIKAFGFTDAPELTEKEYGDLFKLILVDGVALEMQRGSF